jgi:hypothetical protein
LPFLHPSSELGVPWLFGKLTSLCTYPQNLKSIGLKLCDWLPNNWGSFFYCRRRKPFNTPNIGDSFLPPYNSESDVPYTNGKLLKRSTTISNLDLFEQKLRDWWTINWEAFHGNEQKTPYYTWVQCKYKHNGRGDQY